MAPLPLFSLPCCYAELVHLRTCVFFFLTLKSSSELGMGISLPVHSKITACGVQYCIVVQSTSTSSTFYNIQDIYGIYLQHRLHQVSCNSEDLHLNIRRRNVQYCLVYCSICILVLYYIQQVYTYILYFLLYCTILYATIHTTLCYYWLGPWWLVKVDRIRVIKVVDRRRASKRDRKRRFSEYSFYSSPSCLTVLCACTCR